MFKNCSHCGALDPGPREDAMQFAYKGLTFTVFKVGGYCRECTGRDERAWFDEFAEELIVRTQEQGLRVNWEYYNTLREADLGRSEHAFGHPNVFKMNAVLLALGVFSLKPEGHWTLMTHQALPLNPSAGSTFFHLYFIHREDAEEYARHRYAQDTRLRELWQIGRVVPKEKIVRSSRS